MIYKVFTVFDAKALAYMQPFFSPTQGEAIRLITELANDSKHNFHKYAEDFHLFELGEFDNLKAQFIMHDSARPLIKCIELIKPKE